MKEEDRDGRVVVEELVDVVVIGVLDVEMEEILEVGLMELKRDGCGGGLKKEEEIMGGFVEDGDIDSGGRRWKEGRGLEWGYRKELARAGKSVVSGRSWWWVVGYHWSRREKEIE